MITDVMTRVDENTENVSVTCYCGIGSAKKTQNTAVLQRYNITARGWRERRRRGKQRR